MPSKKPAETKARTNVKDLPEDEPDVSKDASLFIVEATMLSLPAGSYAHHGDFLTPDDLGEMKDLHLERGAIRAATHEEEVRYEKKGKE